VVHPDALSTLVRLTELRLDDNCIRSLAWEAPAAGGAQHESTTAAATGPAQSPTGSVRPGQVLPQLVVLQLRGNRLADTAELEKLGALPNLLEVSLAGNPVARREVGTETSDRRYLLLDESLE